MTKHIHTTAQAANTNTATPINHAGVPCVVIPLKAFTSIIDDMECLTKALDSYRGIFSIMHHQKLSPFQTEGLVNSAFLSSDIHSDIIWAVFGELLKYLPADEQKHYTKP